MIVRRGTPRAPRRARSSAEAFLSLGAVSYLFVAFTRVLLRPNERITNARAAQLKNGFCRCSSPAALGIPLTEEETAALSAGGRAADLVRRGVAARARDVDLEAKGKAKEVKKRQQNRKSSVDTRKRKKAKVEDLVQEEARLMERGAGLLADLGRGGSTVLDVLDREAFREDEEAIKALVAARDREKDKKERKNLTEKVRRARQKLAAKELQLRVALLEDRVAELEEELRAQAAA